MSGRIPKVVVVGGTYIDMVVRCSNIPVAGQSVKGSKLSYNVTGPGPNEAVEAALCGCQVHLIGKVGGDPFGQMARQNLLKSDVNVDFVYTAEAKYTGTIVTLVNAAGGNASCIYTGANGAISSKDIEAAEQIISDADICLIHGQLPQDGVTQAIRLAKIHGTKVILNPAVPIESNRNGREKADELPIEYFSADILIPNLSEAAAMTETSAANVHTAKLIGSDLVARGATAAVITMGKRGCMVVDRNGADHIPAFEVELVDQTGRGDAFAGALAAYCAVKDDLREAVKFASAAGALACTKFGTIEALPTKAEIIQLLQSQDTE
ncbi:MAG: ribokinase [Sedimentisphaerales bacterium]|nr:ribokinase [Sedimentisphaerales bacterium]